MKFSFFFLLLTCTLICQAFSQGNQQDESSANPPIYIAFLWHMHQPIYWPYETVTQTDQNGRYGYSVTDIHNQRLGPYNAWPKDAVQKGIAAGMPHFGAQVSFSGSLIENLNNLESAGNGNFQNWKSHWNTAKLQNTSLGNPRLDMVGFGYHHPLMGLIGYQDIRNQIQAHKQIMSANFSGSYSKGIFPPENAFSPREIPALVDEGIEWALVDNIHFDRACQGYPFNTSGNLYEPNKADQLNNNPNDWVQLNGLWAPTQNSARWGRQPHYVEYVDPATGTKKKIIAIPADRYMGNEDGRGGFGALNYENVMSHLESYNTDPSHPILIVLHHDGDNYGGGTDSYYGSNFQNFVNWLQSNPTRFVCTTIQDYLEMFPPDTNDVIHVEDGSWSGADNGDPEFKKWNGDPSSGYSPDRNSWGIITAAKNFVATADQINPSSANTQNAWKYFLNGEASDYWYWDGSQNGIWDSHPARASNLAIPYAQAVIAGGTDLTPPTIYIPQREPYNPGGTEWGINQPNNFTVWTYAFDVSGLKSVTLRYRTDLDGVNSSSTVDNETYAGGSGVSAWTNITMTGTSIPSQTNPAPLFKAKEYSAQVTGHNNVLIDYYVEAVDSNNNIARSPVMHVWVGANTGGGGGGGGTVGVSWLPLAPTDDDTITITVSGATQGAKLHWGVNYVGSSWQTPNAVYRPVGSTLFNGTGPAVETPMLGPDTASKLILKLGPFNNAAQVVNSLAFVIHYNNDTWDNNGGQDYHITISGTPQPQSFIMDGSLDTSADLVSTNAGLSLYVGWNGTQLYMATQSAQSQSGDMFVFLADSQRALKNAQWAKSGQVATWSYFLGNESSNNWNGWFTTTETQATGYTLSAAGSILEGAINLQSAFGSVPQRLYLAIGKYDSPDGGSLGSQVPAGNGNGSIESVEWFLYEFDSTVVVSPPAAPVLISPANFSTHLPISNVLRWNTTVSATSYHVQLATDSLFTSGIVMNSTGLADTSANVSGLSNSTTYFWRVRASNAGGTGNWSAVWRFTTALSLPGAVILLSPVQDATIAADSVQLHWRKAVPAVEKYWLEWSFDSLFTSSTIDSTITDTTSILYNLDTSSYWWKVKAKNEMGWGAFSAPRKFTVSFITIYVGMDASKGWNMVSLPVVTSADSVAEFIPLTSLPYAFSYMPGSGYQQETTITPGIGYWIKLSDGGSFEIAGTLRSIDTIDVSAGWNMIGTISFPVSVGSIITEPEGIVTSPFYGFDNGYLATETLIPGKAYWVKVNASGKIMLRVN